MKLRDDNTATASAAIGHHLQCFWRNAACCNPVCFVLKQVHVDEIANRVHTQRELQERRILWRNMTRIGRQSNARLQALLAGSPCSAGEPCHKLDELRADAEALHGKTTRLNASLLIWEHYAANPEERLKELRAQSISKT